ncbi:MAG TPA: hypothetical protein PKW33_10980 [Anaerolineaceae bacterium]|nr:hypothetical protein [Anaerolineaceae bacterium]HPN52102.1 hypothetical protein [Anaerolineaceae bacterium]
MKRTLIYLAVLLVFLLSACANPNPTAANPTAPAGTRPPTQAVEPTLPPATPTAPQPTATPRPAVALLVIPAGADPALVSILEVEARDLAAADGLELRVLPALTQADLQVKPRLVVALAPLPDLPALAAAAPEVQFIAAGMDDLNPAANLTLIRGSYLENQAFLAGYIAAVITPDWRAGTLDTDPAARTAFLNGARYFCGLCKPAYPPFFNYPQVSTEGLSGAQAADDLIAKAVSTAFIPPAQSSPETLAALAKAGVNLIGGQAPSDELRPYWVATLRVDAGAALRQAWAEAAAGRGGGEYRPGLILDDLESGLLNPARLRLVEQVLQGLQDGSINPAAVPD